MGSRVISIDRVIDKTTFEATLEYTKTDKTLATCQDEYTLDYLETLDGAVDALKVFQGKNTKDEEDEEDVTGFRRVLLYLTLCFGRPAKRPNRRGVVSPVSMHLLHCKDCERTFIHEDRLQHHRAMKHPSPVSVPIW
jgi:hypothetical protein